ncbi:hypothetical protein [Bifidobacterium breve]|uniref:hypothetical protein n=1 Tax=Bifidobacterium breve TaxID=1685 RepID=UPI0004B4D612|nr:hypothetical protein [Bifidobacterium breve]
MKGAKLGIVNVFNGGNSEVDETFKAAQNELKKVGATLVNINLDVLHRLMEQHHGTGR